MKRIRDNQGLPDEWFMGCKPLNEPDAENDTLWKFVLWSGSGYGLDRVLCYAPREWSEVTLESLVAALDKNGDNTYFVEDYFFDNPNIDEDVQSVGLDDVYDYIDWCGDYYVDATAQGGGVHVLRGENFDGEPTDKPAEFYEESDEVADSRRVKDDRFDDVTGEIQKGIDAYADVFFPYDQSNPENGEFFRNNRDRFKKHFSGRGVSVSERELSGRNGLYFERMKDSHRVKDSEDNEEVAEVVVSVISGESMSNAEGRKYANEIKNAIEYKQFSQGGEWCESQDFEWMDRVGEGESVAVWGIVYGSSWNTIKSSVEEWVESLGFDVDVELYDYVE